MNMTLFISANENMSIGNAALYSLIGFLIVVAVLALLVGIFYLSGAIFRSKLMNGEGKKKKPAEKQSDAVESTDDDGEVVAAVTAAISMMLAEESDGDVAPDFVIRRVTRKK